jgi:D-alanyl-D-alanine carboxypeptidase
VLVVVDTCCTVVVGADVVGGAVGRTEKRGTDAGEPAGAETLDLEWLPPQPDVPTRSAAAKAAQPAAMRRPHHPVLTCPPIGAMTASHLRPQLRPAQRYRLAARLAGSVAALTAFAGLTGCGSAKPTRASSAPTVTTSAAAPTTTTRAVAAVSPTTTTERSTASQSSPFEATVRQVSAADLPYTWRPGCPVPPSQLRMLHLSYWGFDSVAHEGSMVVNVAVVDSVIQVFRTLYDERFSIDRMVPQDAYRGDDNSAAAADDTSGFNCRNAVASGPPHWSEHAYGEAIDVNDVQNPYVAGSTVIPPEGRAYLNRGDVRPGMALPGGELVSAFASVGWQWGGRWTDTPDYQHFSANGG